MFSCYTFILMHARTTQLGETLVRLIGKWVANEKKPRTYGVAQPLYPSEIHMIMMIGNHPDMHLAELARRCGITRGAASQTIARLARKGLVEKTQSPQNRLKMQPALTADGKAAYAAHEQRHQEMDRRLLNPVAQLSDEQFTSIASFFDHIEKMLDNQN